PRGTRQATGTRARRSAVRAGRTHRGAGRGGAGPATARDDRAGGGAPPVDRGAGRPGGAAVRRRDRGRGYPLGTAGHRPGIPGGAVRVGRLRPAGGLVTVDVEAWRGRAAEENAERTAAEGGSAVRLRAGSRALLGSLLRPHRRALALI